MIKFNSPYTTGKEHVYLADAINRGELSGDGFYTDRCESMIRKLIGVHYVHLTHSCTAALEMAAILANLGAGDEVILPSYTFTSTANSIILRGATPVFVDIDDLSLNIDPREIVKAITHKTKAIFLVHYAGVICDMPAILAIAEQYNLIVVEDAAQALGSSLYGAPAGSFGALAAFSFHATKNVIAGEGGCLVTNAESLSARASIIREKGTNRDAFLLGQVDKYGWVDLGSSYLPNELTAAFLAAQLEETTSINKERMEIWESYHLAFNEMALCERVRLPETIPGCQHNAHMYYLRLPKEGTRRQFIKFMREHEVQCFFHYQPLHSSAYGKKVARVVGSMTVTNEVAETIVRLPIYPGLGKDIQKVIGPALEFLKHL